MLILSQDKIFSKYMCKSTLIHSYKFKNSVKCHDLLDILKKQKGNLKDKKKKYLL